MMERNPYAVLEIANEKRWPEGFDPYEAALENFKPEDLTALSRLLRSANSLVSQHGLFLFGELGNKAYSVVDDALALVDHPDIMARNGLLDGILCYPEKLSSKQVSKLLLIADILDYSCPQSAVIRGKLIVFIGAHEKNTISDAIGKIRDDQLRILHRNAFETAQIEIEDTQTEFDKARSYLGVELLYSMSGLVSAARHGAIDVAPSYEDDDFVSDTVVRVIRRSIDNNFKRKDPETWLQKKLRDRRKKPKLADAK